MNVLITGTRGVPAQHGGFETFAQDLSEFLVSRGHRVTVYCQSEQGPRIVEDTWNGIRRILIPSGPGAVGTMKFDLQSLRHARKEPGVILTLGYNTAIFNLLTKLSGHPTLINMDGIEWKRAKWSRGARVWLWANEWFGARFSSHMIADHPEIKAHLVRHSRARDISVIPYGADRVDSAPTQPITSLGLESDNYFLVVARPERENSILEIVQAHAAHGSAIPLVLVGRYSPDHPYHQQVLSAAGPSVKFVGAIYQKEIIKSLRYHSAAYIHGHTVGGTNPSLVESIAAGAPVVAHANRFNRWVAGPSAMYFTGTTDLAQILNTVASDRALRFQMREGSYKRHSEEFTQELVLGKYEELLSAYAYKTADHPLRKTAVS